jgi:hypothetical protein
MGTAWLSFTMGLVCVTSSQTTQQQSSKGGKIYVCMYVYIIQVSRQKTLPCQHPHYMLQISTQNRINCVTHKDQGRHPGP